MDDITKSKRTLLNDKRENKKNINLFITKVLLSIIFVLTILIASNYNNKFLLLMKNRVINSNWKFSYFNNEVSKLFGKSVLTAPQKTQTVFYEEERKPTIESINDKTKIIYDSNTSINAIQSGIVVFAGEKDDLGYTVIIQGIDECDIWYSNLTNNNINLYDYVEKGQIIGEVNDYLIIDIIKNKKHLIYEEYIKQV